MGMTIVLGVVGLVVGILVVAAMRPSAFRIERRTNINAPPDRVFSYLNDFLGWRSWSPWEGLDPDLRRTYSTNTAGLGATYAWAGNSKVGEGRMEIVESTPSSKVGIKLDFLKPFEAHNLAEFSLTPHGAGTEVVWSMTGRHAFAAKVMTLFVSMDKLVGKDFEKGLANLKSVAEA